MVPRGPQVHLHLVKCCSGLESMQISPRSLEEHIIKVLSRKISEISKVLNARLSQAARIPDPRTISIAQSVRVLPLRGCPGEVVTQEPLQGCWEKKDLTKGTARKAIAQGKLVKLCGGASHQPSAADWQDLRAVLAP